MNVTPYPRDKMRVEMRSAMDILDRAIATLEKPVPPTPEEHKGYESACEAGFSRVVKDQAATEIRWAIDRLNWLANNMAEEEEEAHAQA